MRFQNLSGQVFLSSFLSIVSLFLINCPSVSAATTAPISTYVQEDFNTGTTQTWADYRNSSSVSNGKLNLAAGTAITAISSMVFKDFVLNCDIYVNSDGDGGIFFRSSNPANEDGYYVGLYANTDEIRLYKLNSSSPFIAAAQNVTIEPGAKCPVKIVAKGSNIKVYANSMEIPVLDINDSTYSSGLIGVRSFNARASYDNLNILVPKYLKNVYVINFDPLLESKGSGYYLHNYVGYAPKSLKSRYVTDIQTASHNTVYYNVVGWEDWDEYPQLTCGVKYNDVSYLAALDQKKTLCNSFDFDYNHYFVDESTSNAKQAFVTKIKNLINAGKVDEVFIFADGTDMGLSESMMIGNATYFCNSNGRWYNGLTSSSYNKNFVAMFFNYNRLDDCMLESFGHRAESIMKHKYGRWINEKENIADIPGYPNLRYRGLNNWERFTLIKGTKDVKLSGDPSSVIGCGFVHCAPNTEETLQSPKITFNETYGDSWGKTLSVNSNYQYWMQYPKTGVSITTTTAVDCSTWGREQKAHHMWWLGCFPSLTDGNAPDGYLADWWSYLVNL